MRVLPAVVFGLSIAICGPSVAHAEDLSFHRSLNVTGPVTLNVCTGSGDVHVFGGNGNTVQIDGKIHKGGWSLFGASVGAPTDEMRKIAANPPIQQTGDVVRVGNHETCSGHIFHNLSINYEISVPRNATVTVDSGSGDLRVENVGGSLHAETGSGDIRANGIGTGSSLETGSGNIVLQGAQGTMKAQTGSGDLTIRDSQLSNAQLGTGSGDIDASYVRGGLKAETGSGNLTVSGSPTSDWKLDTGSGSIHFHADASAKFTLDAESDSGDIDSKLPISVSGRIHHDSLHGPVNGGGPTVKMRTGSGDITLQ